MKSLITDVEYEDTYLYVKLQINNEPFFEFSFPMELSDNPEQWNSLFDAILTNKKYQWKNITVDYLEGKIQFGWTKFDLGNSTYIEIKNDTMLNAIKRAQIIVMNWIEQIKRK